MSNHVVESLTRTSVLAVAIVLLLAGVGRADRIDNGGGNFTFDTSAPNPYTSSVFASGGNTVNYLAGAEHVVHASNYALRINTAGYTLALSTNAVINNTHSTGLSIYDYIVVNNSGSILSNAIAIYNPAATDITNQTAGVIQGGSHAIYKTGAGAIDNRGQISASGTGVYVMTSTSVSFINRTNGSITGTDAVLFETAPSSFFNEGLITGTSGGGAAVRLNDGGTVNNEATGTITGSGYGVRGANNFNNYGSVSTTDIAVKGDSQTIVVDNHGSIASTNNTGIQGQQGGMITNRSGATVEGRKGIELDGLAGWTLRNYGTITGNVDEAVRCRSATITNYDTGVITSGWRAIEATESGTSVDNRGTITSQGNNQGYAILMDDGGSVTNQSTGMISSQGLAAIRGADQVINYGSIQMPGNSWAAIQTSADSGSSVTLHTGCSVLGGVSDLGGSGDVFNLDGAGAGTFDQGLNGFETLRKHGGGTWTLPGGTGFSVNSFEVHSGTLVANGTFTSTTAFIANAATLMGAGTFNGGGTLTVQNGGTLAPGNSIGTMTVNGDLNLDAGSTLEIEVNVGASDALDVNGAVTLGGTLSVVDLSAGALSGTSQFDIIDATGGYTGDFDDIVDDSAVLDFSVAVNGTVLTLTGRPERTYAEVAGGGNSRSCGGVLDTARNAGQLPTLTNELDTLNDAQLRDALQSLGPGTSASMTGITQQTTQQFSMNLGPQARASRAGMIGLTSPRPTPLGVPGRSLLAMADHDPVLLAYAMQEADEMANAPDPAEPTSQRFNLFVTPFGQFGKIDNTSDRVGYDFYAAGMTAGFDYALNRQWVLGLSVAYLYSEADYDANLGQGNAHTTRVGPYLTWTDGPWQVDASVTMGYHWYDNERNVTVGGFNRVASSDHEGYDVSAFGQLAYAIPLDRWTLTPSVSLHWVHLEQDGYTETGAGPANLIVNDTDHDAIRSVLGGRLSRTFELQGLKVMPEAWAGWAFDWLDEDSGR
jgi:outer membrane autotransporter protein